MTHHQIVAHLKGVFPPVVTPFDRRGEVDWGKFRANLKRYAETGLAGIVVAGSTGEAPYLTDRERLRAIEVARELVRPPQLLIAGTGLESTRETVGLSREAVARGADLLLVITPCYFKSRMDSAALQAHYCAIADALKRPIIVYSIPQFTGVWMDPKALARLSRHPNVVGIKESSGDLAFVRAILRQARPGFRILVGSALIFLAGLRAGAAGGVLGQAGFAPEICVGLYDAFCRRQIRVAHQLQERLLPLAQKISIPYGVAGIKAALDLCSYAGGAPRPPLLPLDPTGRRAVADALVEARAGLEI